MMNSSSSGGGSEPEVDDNWNNVSELELGCWIDELVYNDPRNLLMNSGAAAMTINPNSTQPSTTAINGVMITSAAAMPINPNSTQANTIAINGGTLLRGGPSTNMSQSGIAEIMTANSLAASSSTATPPRSGQILSAAPNFIANTVAQSSWSSRTTDLAQYQPVQPSQPLQNQQLRQSNVIFGHQRNQNLLPSDQLRSYPRPMVNSQTGHLQNQQTLWQQSSTSQLQQPQPQPQTQMVQPIQNFQQNQNNRMQLQFQQPSGSSNNLISEDGRNRFQGFAIGDGQRKPQEQQQGHIATAMAAPAVFRAPSEFPTMAAWSEYALRQISQIKGRYLTDLLVMHRNSKQLCIQGKDTPAAPKYENVKKFLEKMITFLSIPTADMLPNNPERVHGYMNFIVNYLQSFRNKNGGVSSQNPQLLIHQPPQLQPNTGANVRLQYNPQQNLSQGIANLETSMLNFNQNFPSRRPQQPRMAPSSSVNNLSFPASMDQRPANSQLIGSFSGAQPNVLSATPNSSGLLTTTTANNFQSRQLNNQPPAAVAAAHQMLSSERLKQPMQNVNEINAMSPLGSSRMANQFHSAPFSLMSAGKPINPLINQQSAPGRSPWNVVSSSRVDANNVLSPQSIARSPFLLGASSTLSHAEKQVSSGVSLLSTAESKKPETPIMTVQSGDLGTMIKDKVLDTGAASRTPTTSSTDAPSTEKSQESSQELNDPHLRLINAVKSLSSKALSSSLNDICSAKREMDSIPSYGVPTNPIAPYKGMEANFLLEYDNESTNLISSSIEDESGFLLDYENEPERKMRRKLSVTSVVRSSPDVRDLESFDEFVFEEWDMDSTGTSMNKRSKIECKNGAILEEVKEINGKFLETFLEVSEDNISLHGDYEGTIVMCMYKNVSFPELQTLMGGASSQKRPEFVIELLVPIDYPAYSPIVFNSRCNVQGELAEMLFKEMVTRFERAVREHGEKISIGDMARQWDVCGRTVIMELAQQRGGRNLVSSYGRWEKCTYN